MLIANLNVITGLKGGGKFSKKNYKRMRVSWLLCRINRAWNSKCEIWDEKSIYSRALSHSLYTNWAKISITDSHIRTLSYVPISHKNNLLVGKQVFSLRKYFPLRRRKNFERDWKKSIAAWSIFLYVNTNVEKESEKAVKRLKMQKNRYWLKKTKNHLNT